jgi:bifunctional non-homologous end joining protein LigD
VTPAKPKKAPAKKTAAKKAVAKKSAATKSAGRKSAAPKSASRKSAAPKSAGRKSAAPTSASRKSAAATPAKRLTKYRAMRDFERTAEPAGADQPAGPASGPRFVVQRHRARRLHYDFRLEIDGVLASWAVPKGPTLDPKARHLAVHVEDHPMEYADFEGVIPRGEYGGGDVIVWDRGTWQPVETDDAAKAVEAGNLHFDLYGEKLKGRFVLVLPNRREQSGKEQWLILHKQDEFAVPGWDPEQHPDSVKSGRTNDEVAADPDAMWRSDLPADQAEVAVPKTGAKAPVRKKAPQRRRRPTVRAPAPTPAELRALDALGANGDWDFQGCTLKLTNLDKVLFPARDGEAAATKRDLIRYHALVAPTMLPYLVDRPVNLNRFPNGVTKPGFWHKAVPEHAPDWLTRWRYEDARPGDTEWYFIVDSPPALAWMANYGAIELHPWTSSIADVHQPTWAMIDIDPGTKTSFDDVVLLARLFRTALDHLGVLGRPKVTGKRGIQIWVPIASGYTFDDTRAWIEQISRAVGGTVPDLVSWKWHKSDRSGLARLDYTQNAINRTLVAPYSARPAPGAPASVPLQWDELDDPDLRPDRWTIRSVIERLDGVGDPFADLLGLEQELPAI